MSVTQSAGAAAFDRLVANIYPSSSHFVSGSSLMYRISRDASDAIDTAAGQALLHHATLVYLST